MWSLAQKKFNRWSWWVFKLRFPYQAFHANKPGILGRCFPPGPAPHTRLHQGRIKPLQSNQPQNLFVILISSYHSMEKSAFHQCQDSAYQTNAHSRSYLKPHCQSPGKCTHTLPDRDSPSNKISITLPPILSTDWVDCTGINKFPPWLK